MLAAALTAGGRLVLGLGTGAQGTVVVVWCVVPVSPCVHAPGWRGHAGQSAPTIGHATAASCYKSIVRIECDS